MKGKKENLQRGQRPGLGPGDDLMLLKLILDEHPRLRDRVVRYIENYQAKTEEEKKKLAERFGN